MVLPAALLALTGAAAWIHHAAWSRQLAVVVGGSAGVAAAAIAAVLVGVAAGAVGASRVRIRPLLGVAACQAFAALWAVVLPALLGAIDGAPALALLVPVGAALGATAALCARTGGLASAPIAAGLAGAALGAGLATFALLGALGVVATARVSASVALVAAAIAVMGGRGEPVAAPPIVAPPGLLAIAALGGVGLAAAQVLYARLLALTLPRTAHTTPAIAIAMLIALAAGVAIAARLRRREPRAVIAGAGAMAAALVPLSVAALWAMTGLRPAALGGSLAGHAASAIGLAIAVLGAPTATLAVVVSTAGRTDRGLAAAAIAAAIAIPVLALLLAPRAGVWTALALLGALAAAITITAQRRGRLPVLAGATAVATLIGALLAPPAPPRRPGERVVAHLDGADGRLDVVEVGGRRSLRLDLHEALGSSDQLIRLRRAGHLPLLLHEAPRRVLRLGLGTGIAAGASLGHEPLERLDVVEPIAEVVEAAPWFADWTGPLLGDPRVAVHVADPRRWLRAAGGRWDVIVTDLMSPMRAGAAGLYGVDHHRAVAAHLAPGGVYVQWLPLWQLGAGELAAIADATRAVFAQVALWRGDTSRRWGVIAVVASHDPIALDGATLRARVAAIPPALVLDREWSAPAAIAALYAGDWPRRDGVVLDSNDRPRVELEATRTLIEQRALIGARLVGFYREVITPLARTAVRYTPAPGEAPWDPSAGLALQMGGAGADGD